MNTPERRHRHRISVSLDGKIFDGARNELAAVKITNLSPSGANIESRTWSVSLPQRFTLHFIKDAREVEAELVWRRGVDFGVHFLEPPAQQNESIDSSEKSAAHSQRMKGADLRKLLRLGGNT